MLLAVLGNLIPLHFAGPGETPLPRADRATAEPPPYPAATLTGRHVGQKRTEVRPASNGDVPLSPQIASTKKPPSECWGVHNGEHAPSLSRRAPARAPRARPRPGRSRRRWRRSRV